eukprot:TRINITY_DN3520_c0_g1_i4.p1 TRINITY_DN3520_c0_g1~~TRINITY_DN3520_c0_g1_i4.p1  ORF type:complete len:504 (-),score=68.91 TRINITY_DN3520_c0_g1_i4:2189-3580(-)
MGISSKLKSVDFFKKLPSDLAEATITGAGVSIVAFGTIFLLFILELSSFMALKTKSEMVVDRSPQGELVRVNFNISFPALPCEFATMDLSDNLGTKKMNFTKTIRKVAIKEDLSRVGYSIRDDKRADPKHDEEEVIQTQQTVWETPLKLAEFDAMVKKYPVAVVNFYAPWCPWCQRLAPSWDAAAAEMHQRYPDSDGSIRIAKVDCTEERDLCRFHQVMGYPGIRVFRDGKDVVKVGDREEHEAYHGDRTKDALLEFFESTITGKHKFSGTLQRVTKAEGCNFAGFVLVRKVPGTMHFHFNSGSHSFDHSLVNTTHVIHSFYYGMKPSPFRQKQLERLHPLGLNPDWADKLKERKFMSLSELTTHEHYLQVVLTTVKPRTYQRGSGDYDAYEYTVHSHTYNTETTPASKISFDFSPIQIVVTEESRHWYHFATTTCAIIGGAFTVLGLIDGILYQGLVKTKIL